MVSMRLTLALIFTASVAAATVFAAPVPANAKNEEPNAVKVRKALDLTADFKLDQMPLQSLADTVRERFGVDLIIDTGTLNASGMDLSTTVITVNRKGAKLRDGLKIALNPLGLRYGITSEGIIVSTEEGVVQKQMRQRIDLDGGNQVLPKVLNKLASESGVNIVLDPRAVSKANNLSVELRLDDVPLETAVRLSAEVAGFRAVRMNNVLFVTTEDRAKVLREDADSPSQPPPFFPFTPGFQGGAIPIPLGPAQAQPAIPVPVAPVPEVEQKKPEEKKM